MYGERNVDVHGEIREDSDWVDASAEIVYGWKIVDVSEEPGNGSELVDGWNSLGIYSYDNGWNVLWQDSDCVVAFEEIGIGSDYAYGWNGFGIHLCDRSVRDVLVDTSRTRGRCTYQKVSDIFSNFESECKIKDGRWEDEGKMREKGELLGRHYRQIEHGRKVQMEKSNNGRYDSSLMS